MSNEPRATWRFPRDFWSANVAELFERAAYYGVFIGLAVYLTSNYGFSDVGAGYVGAYFSGALYLAPAFAGALADRMGFRGALAFAFASLAVGYLLLGLFGVPAVGAALGRAAVQIGAVAGLTVIVVGGAFVKAVIAGTVARSSDEVSRARAFAIFYLMVNVGAFSGKLLAYPLRVELGLEYVSFFSAAMGVLGLATVLLLYKGAQHTGEGKSMRDTARAFVRVLRNGRFVALLLIVAGFWLIQGQMYAAMPKYVLRMVGPEARPEWLANINPLVVLLFVLPITHVARRLRPVTSIGIALLVIPISALMMSLAPALGSAYGASIDVLGVALHPITISVAAGISLQGLAECFLSPRYLEFASRQAPPGEEGLYMGFSHLHTLFAWVLGFILSGYLLDAFCPDPQSLPAAVQAQWAAALKGNAPMPDAYAHAHYIWYVFVGVGVASFVLLMVFRAVTDRADARRRPASARAP